MEVVENEVDEHAEYYERGECYKECCRRDGGSFNELNEGKKSRA